MTDATTYQAPNEAEFRDYVALLKPRVMSLVVFTAFVGLIVAPGNVHPLIAFCSVLFIWGGWRVMRRTDEQSYADGHKLEKSFFNLSLIYLFAHFAALLVQHWVGA